MAAPDRQHGALQIIFSFFLGLMVTAFIGVGVYTFYAPPEQALQDKLQKLYRQQEDIQNFKEPAKLSDADKAQLKSIQSQIRDLEDKSRIGQENWARNSSIILVTFATIIMSISLIRADQLRVISNGLLLGGIFTMLYGVGWIIASRSSQGRFWVITAALAITIGLGYLKFVRDRASKSSAGTALAGAGAEGAGAPIASAEVAGLVARVAALEGRLGAAAAALGEKQPPE